MEKVKAKICSSKIKAVSFDIFDTLLLRPVFRPADFFILMNGDFKRLMPDYENTFLVTRLAAEKSARMVSENGEVTIGEIYSEMVKNYDITEEVAEKLKSTEISLEVNGCYARKTAKLLYDFVIENGKKVIISDDSYLSTNTIKEILEKNGFTKYEKLYISCEVNKTKSSGSMYQHIMEDNTLSADEILHIGDDFALDVEMPRKLGIESCYMPSPSEMVKNTSMSSSDEKIYFEARCNLMAFANKYFDDPFKKGFSEDVLTKHQSDDGLAEKINSILPTGSKKRKFAENIASKLLGK